MVEFADIKNIITENSKDLSEEFKRVFHGRDNYYDGWKFLTVDSVDKILSAAFYYEVEKTQEDEVLNFLKEFTRASRHETIILQRRYLKNAPTEIIAGELPENNFALENGLKIKLNLKNNQNSGYFPDMKGGREYIKSISKDKKRIKPFFLYLCLQPCGSGGRCKKRYKRGYVEKRIEHGKGKPSSKQYFHKKYNFYAL